MPGQIPGKPGKVPGVPARIKGQPRKNTSGDSGLKNMESRYSSGGSGIRWVGLTEIASNFRKEGQKMENARAKAAELLSIEILTYAIQHAPWTDRTGDARRELNVRVAHIEREHRSVVILAHGVDYGEALETMQGGVFSIIIPTIRAFEHKTLPVAVQAIGGTSSGDLV